MKRVLTFCSGVLVALGAWGILQKFEIHSWQDLRNARPGQSLAGNPDGLTAQLTHLTPARAASVLRIAAFNIPAFGENKAAKPQVMDILARIVRQFDIVAIQGIRTRGQDLLPNFLDLINAGGRRYDGFLGPRLGRGENKAQYAFLYDMATVEVDRSQLYTVADPDDLLAREPLVAWFRARAAPRDQAFTFSLANVDLAPDDAPQELDVLADVYRAVRNDGRQEDDVILLGHFSADSEHLGRLSQIPGFTPALARVPTDTRGVQASDNLVFSRFATLEYTGRAGVFDFLREYNLTLEEALEISDHLPVWAEFSVYEGGQAGRLAGLPAPEPR